MNRRFALDLAERASMTFLQAFAAIIVARGTVDWLTLKAAAIAGGLAVAKGLSVKRVGNKDSGGIAS